MGVFLHDIADCWVNDFGTSGHWSCRGPRWWVAPTSVMQLASTVTVPVQRKRMGNAANGSWEKHCVVGEHMDITNLF
jgi:hypothetical protein